LLYILAYSPNGYLTIGTLADPSDGPSWVRALGRKIFPNTITMAMMEINCWRGKFDSNFTTKFIDWVPGLWQPGRMTGRNRAGIVMPQKRFENF